MLTIELILTKDKLKHLDNGKVKYVETYSPYATEGMQKILMSGDSVNVAKFGHAMIEYAKELFAFAPQPAY